MSIATFNVAVNNVTTRADDGQSEKAAILYTTKQQGIRVVAHLKNDIMTLTEYTTGYFLCHLPDGIPKEKLPAEVDAALANLITRHGVEKIEALIYRVSAVRNREEDLPDQWRKTAAPVPVEDVETTDDPELAEMLGIVYKPAAEPVQPEAQTGLDVDEYSF